MGKQNIIKKRLLALGLACMMIGFYACSNKENEEDELPIRQKISSEYSEVEKCYKYMIENGVATKVYNCENVYLLFNKETLEVSEFLYHDEDILFGAASAATMYDLETEEVLVYSNGISNVINEEYFDYIVENNYQVCLSDVCDYVEGIELKEYYSLEEIRDLEPKISEGLKLIIDHVKNNTLVRSLD